MQQQKWMLAMQLSWSLHARMCIPDIAIGILYGRTLEEGTRVPGVVQHILIEAWNALHY